MDFEMNRKQWKIHIMETLWYESEIDYEAPITSQDIDQDCHRTRNRLGLQQI